jgi:hypothetical protein
LPPDPSSAKYNRGLLAALCFATDYQREGCGTFSEGIDMWGRIRERLTPSNVIYLAPYLNGDDDGLD